MTSAEITDAALRRIAALDGRLNSFIAVTEERARVEAAAADADFARGRDHGPLHGVPYALKDNIDAAGIATTCHSKLMVENVPSVDSEVTSRLCAGRGVCVGKLAMHEFALGGPSFDLPFPPARNPWDLSRTPGGSSSGAGAAVAAGLVRVAIGTDTGGSLRGPPAYCGVVGLKPTFGLVSTRGIFPLSYSLDHCGPIGSCVDDVAAALQVIAGHRPPDAARPWPRPAPYHQVDDLAFAGLRGLRVGLIRQFYSGNPKLDPEVGGAIDSILSEIADEGAVVEDVTLRNSYEVFDACARVMMYSEAFAIHERDFQARPNDFAALTYMRMCLGAFVTASDIVQASRMRRDLFEDIESAFARFDVLVTASALTSAPRFSDVPDGYVPPHWPVIATPFNLTGHPALAVPAGMSSEGLPLSLQVVGRFFREDLIFRVGHAVEKLRPLPKCPF